MTFKEAFEAMLENKEYIRVIPLIAVMLAIYIGAYIISALM